MKPIAEQIEVEGHLPTEGRRFTFDEDSIAHIMRILTDLYSDPEQAVIRELSTNAIDSHIMAGNTDPIKVYTPSPLTPYFVVSDQGLGLSVDEIYALFGKYGASTKRDTDKATGMLGLGSKSPLTYTNQFIMTAVKDGVRAVVSITRNPDGVGQLTIVDTVSTTDLNGVEVKIPVKANSGFARKAKEFFSYWRAGTVLLDDQDPTGFDSFLTISDRFHIRKTGRYDTSGVIVMGNVPYETDLLACSNLGIASYGYSPVAYVDIGEVEFVPSREALDEGSQRTQRAIERITREFQQDFTKAVQAKLDAEPTAWDALVALKDWRDLTSSRPTHYTWRGRALPVSTKIDPASQKHLYILRVGDVGRTRTGAYSTLGYDHLLNAIVVEDFDFAQITPTHKRKLNQWYRRERSKSDPRPSAMHFMIVDFKLDCRDIIPKDRLVDWSEIQAEKLAKPDRTGATGRIPGSFDVYLGGVKRQRIVSGLNYGGESKYGVPGDQINQRKPVYWIHGNHYDAKGVADVLDEFHDEYTIIWLPFNRIAKFKRENPKIKNAGDEIHGRAEQLSKSMTEDQKKALAIQDRGDHGAGALKGHRLDDPDLREFCRLATLDVERLRKARRQFRNRFSWPTIPVVNPFGRYRLWNEYEAKRDPGHIVRYLNSEYRFQKKAKAS